MCATAQLLIYIKANKTNKDFEITEELATMQSMKGKITGNDLFVVVNTCIHKLLGVATDGYPDVSGENVDLKRTQDRVTEINLKQELLFFALHDYQEVLNMPVLKISHMTDVTHDTQRSGGSLWEKD